MSREWRHFWADIVVCCQKVRRYTSGMDLEAFKADERTYDATIRNLEIIGEAVKQLPDEARALTPDIEWRKIAGLRDFLAHAYFGINDTILWDIVQSKVPELLEAMQKAELTPR